MMEARGASEEGFSSGNVTIKSRRAGIPRHFRGHQPGPTGMALPLYRRDHHIESSVRHLFQNHPLSLTLIKPSWKPYHVSQESEQACKNTWAGKSLAARSPLEHAAEAIEGPHALHPPRKAPRPYLLQPCKVLADGGKTKRFDLFDRDRTEEKHKQLEWKNDEA